MKQRQKQKEQETKNMKHGDSCSVLRAPCCVPRGFTFVETLVAISILLLAVAAPLTLASQGLTASRISRDSTIATYLGQEAIEYVRNIRDTNALAGASWLSGLEGCIDGVGCAIDVRTDEIDTCDAEDACEPMMFNTENGAYGLEAGGDWEETKFTRRVLIETGGSAYEVNVSAIITWEDGIRDRELIIQEYMFDWP